MKIETASTAGFCFGVNRAVKILNEKLDEGRKVCTLGPIIHNPQVIEELGERGAQIIEKVADAPEDKIMLDIIWDSVCSDFGLNYSHMSETLDRVIYMVPNLTHANTTESLASYVQSVEKGCDKALSAFFKKLQILKDKMQ